MTASHSLACLIVSTGCFWMKQVFYPKGGDHVGQEGARVRKTLWDERYDFDATKLKQFPIASEKPLELATRLDSFAQKLGQLAPAKIAQSEAIADDRTNKARPEYEATRHKMIALQEEPDWKCYRLYGLLDEPFTMHHYDAPEINLGERAFEIVMAR
jgi:hypothetical protein